MIVYTAEDFAQANLATKGRFGVAHRVEPHLTHQWRAYGEGHGWFSDEEMAADGWVPVMEGAAHDRIMTLLNTKNTLERTVHELRHDLAVARKERERLAHDLRRSLGRPKGDTAITLDALEAAWEAAERADECRKGDVLIWRDEDGGFHVCVAGTSGSITRPRILSRAPKREPWADLADVLRAWDAEPADADADGMAKWFYERGVRATGGDET